MSWQRRVNRVLHRATGYELRRVAGRRMRASSALGEAGRGLGGAALRAPLGSDRLLVRPVFVFSSIRSGSTLLRVLLDSHSRLHAPHELHLRGLKVNETASYVEKSMRALGLGQRELEYLLWDRILHRELEHAGKEYLVNKTPGNAFMWRRVATCWPDARFIFLLRHPGAIALSWHAARPSWSLEEAAADAARYMNAVEEARGELSGLTIRYEDLTADPEAVTRRICGFLEIDWEAQMLDYGASDHGGFIAGLGDWTQKIRSGQVQPARPLPASQEVPEVVRDLCDSWGYEEGASTTV